jgi:NAD(P)-dependent dehydrogenase (short-subunit alcohol dehydrogenase family)
MIKKNANDKKLIVITGCDSGIGESLCRVLIKNNYVTAVSFLEKNPFKNDKNVFAKKLDLKNEKEIKNFAQWIKKICGSRYRLDSLVNNAGIAKGGPVENLPLEIYREVFEVNFFGLISLTQKLTPLIIKEKAKIFIMGSMAGLIAVPFLSPYASSKFALEGFCDSLRRELIPFGVRTTILEPGGIATPIWEKAKKQDSSFADKKYSESLKKFKENFIDNAGKAVSPDFAADIIYKILKKKNPKPRYVVDRHKFLTYLPKLLPEKLLDKIFLKLFEMNYGSREK